ncbi:MAG: glycosyl hydrolase-related protein [Planctomycetaceae bacterium]|nr:glycosyl hydrolase-related protein [Planctomycetaceae bacterium]
MKKLSAFFLFFFLVQTVYADHTLWQIGKADSSYNEFFAAKDYEAVAKKFPGDVSVTDFDAKEFPWILPGPVDGWAGAKSHSVNVSFDLPADLPTEPACVLEITGIGQGGHAPLLEIELNGVKQNIQTERGKTGDKLLRTTDGAEWKTYRAYFLFKDLKKNGNTLSIKTVTGSWIIFDALKFRTDDGVIKSFTVTPVPGVFRGGTMDNGVVNKIPARKIRIDFEGKPVQNNTVVEVRTENMRFSQTLSPSGIIDGIPTNDELLKKSIDYTATLTVDGKLIAKPVKFTLPPERKWVVYLVHQTHLDIGYTHLQTEILKKQVQSIRDALKYIDETKDYPEEAKFRFHPEGMWAVDQFLKEATPEEKTAFVKAAKNRDLHIDGLYAQAMTGMYNEEELIELFSSSVRFCKENGIVLDSIMQTDVPGYTWGLVTAMAQNGIKYMTAGPNNGHRVGRLFTLGEKPFWWEAPNGKDKVLCWILSTGYSQWHGQPVGSFIQDKTIFDLLSGKPTSSWGEQQRANLDLKNGRTFLFDDLVMFRYGIESDNGRPNRAVSDAVKAWNEKYLYPKLVVARNSDVMRILEEKYGDKLPTLRGDITGYWEDGAASTAEATSINRRAKEQLIQAETLYSMFAAKKYSKSDFDDAWTNLIMYDEHTWGAHNSISAPDSDFAKAQDEYKQNYARNGAKQTNKLLLDSIDDKDGGGTLLINTLSRQRNGVTFLGNDLAQAPTVRVFETEDGKPVVVQSVADPDGKTVSIYADLQWGGNAPSIPALGTLRLKKSDKQPEEKTGVFRINTETGEMKNNKVHLVIDTQTGAIKSLKLAGSDHNFVKEGDDGNSGLDDYLYIIGRDAEKNRERIKSPAKLTVVANGPLVASVLIEIPESPSFKSFKRQITLFADNDKVRIVNVIDKKKERKPEGMFLGFPFNVPNGKWYVDTPFALVEVEKDQTPGANRNYYPVQRYCSLANEECGVNWVTVDANMIQFAPILLAGPWGSWEQWREKFPEGQPGGTLYSWACNNHWETNYKADQEGELRFEYWVWAYNKNKFNNGIAQRFARQVHQPVITLPTSETAVSTAGSLLTLENEGNVITTGIRPTRDGSGALLVRLFNPTTEKQTTALKLSEPYKNVYKSNPLEEKGDALNGIDLAPFEVLTVRVE